MIKRLALLFMGAFLLLSLCACGEDLITVTCPNCHFEYNERNSNMLECPKCLEENPNLKRPPAPRLSDECGYLLCSGTDNEGNFFELVANQTESATGYRIEVGIIKNDEWLYPLSTDFPFLNSKGLFPIDGDSVSLSKPRDVISELYFVDTGGFMLENHKTTLGGTNDIRYFFDCDTLQMISDTFSNPYTGQRVLLYRYSDATFGDNGVKTFGKIYTDNGLLCITDRDKNDSDKYAVELLDLNVMEVRTIASGLDFYAKNTLSEGLIFASDNAFYDTNWTKVIDVSQYDIITFNSSISFKNGQCTFVARNDIGSEFNVTIDKTGKVISEVKIK